MPLFRSARLAALGALLLASALAPRPAAAQASADTAACGVLWQVTASWGSAADAQPQLQLRLRFPAGRRNHTGLHLPGGWTGHIELPAQPGDGPRLQPRPGEPAWRDLAHAPGSTVDLQWTLQPTGDAAQGGHAQLGATWFAFSGQGVLPMPEGLDEPGAAPACIALQGLGPDGRWASSHGTATGASALFVLGPSPVPLAQRVQQALYAGGALQLQPADGVVAVLPAAVPWRFGADTVARAGARALATQQRQWPAPAGPRETTPPWLLLVLPATAAAAPDTALASAWHHALALQLPPAWPGADAALEAQFTHALARAWTAERFGPLAHAGRADAVLRAWFSDGWADFLAHRSLLRAGLWTPDDYAAALNSRIAAYLAEPARMLPNNQLAGLSLQAPQLAALQALRGEWLALQWHLALRRAGHPGLDAVLRQLLVPAAQARRDGPISAPLATHRVVAALRAVLQDQPLRDLQQHIDQGQPFSFAADSLGPCFQATAGAAAPPTYRPVAGALHQTDCQGWLGGDPQTEALALAPRVRSEAPARAGSRQAQRQAAAKAARKAGAKAKPGAKAPAKAGKPAAKSGSRAASKPAAGKPAR